jgi:hypothetical protein
MLKENYAKNEDTLDSYIIVGKHLYSKKPVSIGGDITVDENLVISGTMGDSRDNKNRKVKGFVTNDIDLEGRLSLIMLEWPIKKNATNTVYFAQQEVSKNIDQKKLKFDGKYIGSMYIDVSIDIPEELVADNAELPLAEFLLGNMEYDVDNGINVSMELENYKQNKVKAA